MTKFWNFAPKDEKTVELRIDGDIVDDSDVWLYEWIGETCTSPNAFREALNAYKGMNINVWIDSFGGSVFAATGIYNALAEHVRQGGTVTTIGDGKVMSAATVIFMAGQKRQVTKGCVFMIHNPLTSVGGYAEDLRKTADILDVVKESIINAYESTGKSREELSDMMNAETYMDANQTVQEGFATEILQVSEKAADNNSPVRALARKAIVAYAETDVTNLQKIIKGENGNMEKKVEIKNVADLKNQYTDLCEQIKDDAIKAERSRMQALDALADGSEQVAQIINHAKETGQTAEDVQFFVDTAKAANAKTVAVSDVAEPNVDSIVDKKVSGAENVGIDKVHNEADEEREGIQAMVKMLNRKRGK
mgnify:FL=1|jgi:ATP-dependent protease ClpP protease subunit